MNEDTLQNLLNLCEQACDVPLVYSRPLILLNDALSKIDLDDIEDENLSELLDSAHGVANGWSFYPPEQYGSNLAVISADTVIELQNAIVKYKERKDNE
jgi:hypothetical protein